jgi:hypothetical protein
VQQDLHSEDMKSLERLLVGLETPPWEILYRAALGYGALLVASNFSKRDRAVSEWVLVPVLLAIFAALRVAPLIVRKLVPFSKSAQDVWVQRRGKAKRYDSYQWRKLLGFGIGLAVGTIISGWFSPSRILVSSFCLIGGVAGTIRWRATAKLIDAPVKLQSKQLNQNGTQAGDTL